MKTSRLFFILFLCSLSSLASAQITFEKTYCQGNGYFVQQTTDGGYIVTGDSTDGTNSFIYLLKTDPNGNTLWYKTFGGGSFPSGDGYCVRQTNDAGYIICGVLNLFPVLIKTDANGDTLWTKRWGGKCVQQTFDGGYVVTDGGLGYGATSRLNASGDTLWMKNFGGRYVEQTSDSGFIITGQDTAQNGNVSLIRTNPNGDTLWTKSYGGAQADKGLSVQQTSNGGFIISGSTNSFNALHGTYLILTNSSGDTIWTRNLLGGGGYVRQTFDGGFIVANNTSYFDSTLLISEVVLMKLSGNGDSLWKYFFSEPDIDISAKSIEQTSDSGFIVSGGKQGKICLIKTDANGQITAVYPEPATQLSSIKLFPNPFTDHAEIILPGNLPVSDNNPTIELTLIDVLGRTRYSQANSLPALESSKYRIQLQNIDLPTGIYFLVIKHQDVVIGSIKVIIYKCQ